MKKVMLILISVMVLLGINVYANPAESSVVFEDADGDRIFTYPENNVVYASVNAKEPMVLVVAAYDESDNMLDVKVKTGAEEDGAEYTLKCEYEISDANIKKLKAYAFNAFSDLKPVAYYDELTLRDVSGEGLISSLTPVTKGTTVYDVHPQAWWITEGTQKTDAELSKSIDELFDGSSNTSVTSSSDAQADADGNLVINFDSTVELTSFTVRSMCSSDAFMDSYDVYASNDGENYNFICSAQNGNSQKVKRVMATNCDLGRYVYASSVKLIMHKKQGVKTMQIAEAEVYGKPVSMKKSKATTYDYEEAVPFKTDGDIVLSDVENTALCDGDKGTAVSSSGEYVSVIYDLGDYAFPDTINIYAKASSCEIMTSADGVRYKSMGYYIPENGKITAKGLPGRNAKYVKAVFKKGGCENIEISEVEVLKRDVYDKNAQKNDSPEKVQIYTDLKTNNVLYIDWTDYNEEQNGTSVYNVYIEKSKFAKVTTASQRKGVYTDGEAGLKINVEGKYCCYSGLEPDTDYYVAVAPLRQDVTEQEVTPVMIHTNSALGGEKASKIFNTNDYPNGGGAHVSHPDEKANFAIKQKLLSDMEVMHKTRYWTTGLLDSYPQYKAIGLSYFPQSSPDESGIKRLNENGVYAMGTFNEPDISSYENNPAGAVAAIKGAYERKERVDGRLLLCEPAGAGTDNLYWFESLYQTEPNFGDYYDVVDMHFYCKKFEGQRNYDDDYTDFESGAVPEHIIGKVGRVKNILSEFEGNDKKPFIASEIGWSTHAQTGWEFVCEMVSPQRQADYIARCYLTGFISGISNIYIYAFQDESKNDDNSEYQYGVVDWYGNPKPSYFSSYTLMKVLKDAEYLGEPLGVNHPNYGCSFWDENQNKYITALWTADGNTRKVNLSTDKKIKVITRDGNGYTAQGSDGVTIGSSPIYIISDECISVN